MTRVVSEFIYKAMFEELPCLHIYTVVEEGLKVCTTCGCVLEAQDLTTDYRFSPVPVARFLDRNLHLSYHERCRLRFKLDLQALCINFGVPNLVDAVIELMDTVVTKKICAFGSKRARAFALGCLFVLMVSDKPITLSELCHPWEIDPWRAAACIPILKTEVLSVEHACLPVSDPLLFIERHWQILKPSFPELKDGRLIMKIASGIAETAKNAWITTGRHVEPVSAACILITISSITSNVDLLSIPSIQDTFKDEWPFSARTLYARVSEILCVLHEAAVDLLPWAKTMSEEKAKKTQIRRLATSKSQYGMPLWKSVVSQIPDLLRIRQILGTGDSFVSRNDPPAFTKSTEAREHKLLLIRQAGEHLQSLFIGLSVEIELTRELLDIERLLLVGVSTEELLELTDVQIRLRASQYGQSDDEN